VLGTVPTTGWILWLANMFLVLAYDTEYAMVDRDDDLKIGMKTSAITLGRWDVSGIMVFFALSWLLTLWALAPYGLGWPFALGMAAAAAQILWHFTLIRERTRAGCFVAFSKSHWIGATLFAGVALGFALR
jgi:4-hydroxybenzoate polyprenyltransferase